MSVFEVFTLLGGVGLFLYGMTMMSSGLRNACGEKLKQVLEKATSTKLTALLSGIAVTVFVQSSSAVDVMVIGFVSSGLMTLYQATGVIMGANIGTTITAQITAFNIGAYAPLILFIGAIVTLFMKNRTIRAAGSVVMGFGMLFQGIGLMRTAIVPLAETELFLALISGLRHPLVTVLFGLVFTAILQSSSSATVIFQAFAVQGMITYQTTVYLLIGAAIGSVTPNLLAGLTAGRFGKRSALLNLLFNIFRAILILILIAVFPGFLEWIQNLSPGNVARQIANTHTIFAVVSVLCLLPFSEQLVHMSRLIIPMTPEEEQKEADQKLVYLSRTGNVPPAMVIDQAHREIARMGEIAIRNLENALSCFFEKDAEKRDRVEQTEQTVDYLASEIVTRLVELRPLDMSSRNMNRLYHMIQVVDDIERISDHAENIVEYEILLEEDKAELSEDALAELKQLGEKTMRSLQVCLSVFSQESFGRMQEVNTLEAEVDEAKDKMTQNHVARLMRNACDPQGGVIFTNMCIDLERCSDHGVNMAEALQN